VLSDGDGAGDRDDWRSETGRVGSDALLEGVSRAFAAVYAGRGGRHERVREQYTKRAWLALTIMVLVVSLAALGVVPILVGAVAGVVIMLLTRCLDWEDITAALSVQVIMIIVTSLALGLALVRTGGAEYVAQLYVAAVGGLPPAAVMSGLMAVMAVLTNVVSNNAASVIGTPIAIGIARELGVPLEPFVLAVLFGANLSFATPMAYQTNLLIYSAGGYRFSDFLRAGLPLTLIMWLSLSAALALLYGL
jgi:di/tricarboxylate transporter